MQFRISFALFFVSIVSIPTIGRCDENRFRYIEAFLRRHRQSNELEVSRKDHSSRSHFETHSNESVEVAAAKVGNMKSNTSDAKRASVLLSDGWLKKPR